jgi:hypothetical protein
MQYEGEWQHGQWHGSGKLKLENGKLYQGEFQCGQCHGKGTYAWPDGSTYEGMFHKKDKTRKCHIGIGQTVTCTKENFTTIKSMVKACYPKAMGTDTKGRGKLGDFRAMEFSFGPMDVTTKENSETANPTVKQFFHFQRWGQIPRSVERLEAIWIWKLYLAGR